MSVQNISLFKVLSDEAKAKISNLKVVTPSVYTAIFKDLAKEHHIDVKEEEKAGSKALDEKIAYLDSLDEKTSSHAIQLDESAKRALHAMQEKDENRLQQTILETQALRKEIETLKESVYSDALTKTHNRKWLQKNYLDEKDRFKVGGTLVLIDMNSFKQINDNYGHIAGDKVLAYVAKHMKQTGGDIIRYGGDEFIIIFDENLSKDKIEQNMSANREKLLRIKLKINTRQFKTSFSYGIRAFEKGQIFSGILESADNAMYIDKQQFKKRIQA